MTVTQATTPLAAQRGHAQLPTPPTPPTPPEASTGVPGGGREFVVNPDMPAGAVVVSVMFFVTVAFVIVGLPLARAWARRMDRGANTPAAIPREVGDRLQRIEHAVDSIALEVERISEGQRFTTKLLAEKRADTSRMGGTA